MKREMKLRRVLQVIIIAAALVGMLLIYPGNFFKHYITNTMEAESYQDSGIIDGDINVMQEFIPSQNYLHAITVMVDSLGGSTGLFKLHLYDQALNPLWEDGRRFDESPGIANYTFHVEQEVVAGQPYYYTLDYDCASFSACYTEQKQALQGDNGALYYNLEEIPNSALITSYQYEVPLSMKRIAAYDALLLLIAGIACLALEVLWKKEKRNQTVSLSTTLHMVCGVLLTAITVYAVWQIEGRHIFSANQVENTMLTAGTLLFYIVALYGVLQIRIEHMTTPTRLVNKIPALIQIICWAMAIMACCDFANAGSNYAQGLALRQMCIFFGIAVITMFTKKELMNWYVGIYSVAAVLGVFFYSRMFWGQGEPFQTAIRTAIMCAVAGVVIIVTLCNLIHKKIAAFSWPFAALVGVFFALLLLFRNGNVWEIAVVVPFGLFYIRSLNTEQMDHVLSNITNGIILSFIITTVQALLYRPFHYYTMTRYSGIFMTVTVTAVYLGMIFGVALCKMLIKYQQSHSVSSVWKELVILGVASGYEYLTLSRTGMLSCAVVYVVTCGLYLLIHRKEKTQPIRILWYTVIAIVICLPITYTASRIIPALSNRPKIYLGEEFQDSIRQGEPLDSFRYITIEKLMGKSAERMLGKTDLNFVTQSGKTVQEVLEEAKQKNEEAANTLEESGVTVNNDKLTYVDDFGSEYTIDNPDYSNGRLDIFKKYLQNLNMTGHDAIGLPQEDGTIVVHAHNSFIQMAYDCGILTGVVFLLLYIILGFRSVWYYQKKETTMKYAMLPVVIFATFGISSVVEYVFRPTIPLGFVFLLMIAPLIIRLDEGKNNYSGAELEQK